MPRDGSNIYHYPIGIEGVPDTPVQSAPYNSFLADVEQDLNAARPILAGGTGATNAVAALVALGGEQAGQVVTNYDSFVFKAGSFYSAAGATAAPTANAFAGICYINGGSGDIGIEARDNVDGKLYLRAKTAGVWTSWALDFDQTAQNTLNDARYVNVTGDTMSGDLVIAKAQPTLTLNKAAAPQANLINGKMAGTLRWGMALGDNAGESGSNAGSNFSIQRMSDAGALLDTCFAISRATGAITTSSTLNVTGNIFSQTSTTTGTYHFGSSGTKYLSYDGANFTLTSGTLNVVGDVVSSAGVWSRTSAAGGSFLFGSSGTKVISYDGTNFIIAGGAVAVGTGKLGRPGSSGTLNSFVHNLNWTGSVLNAWVDTTNMGAIAFTSDYRTKKNITELPSMWDVVKALRPIRYTQADYTPPASAQLFIANDKEQWGFIAHELQERLVESASSGVKDSPDTIQSPNPWTVIAALTKALQEAMTRIEALEAR